MTDLAEGAAGDRERLRRAAHTIKSSAKDFGLSRLAAQCTELEKMARNDEIDPTAPTAQAIAEWTRVEPLLVEKVNEMMEGA